MHDGRNKAEEARAVLRDAIKGGVFPSGSTLPSTRELAKQFAINRNTATKIYHELAQEGMIELTTNRPPLVIGTSNMEPEDALEQRLRDALHPLLHESLMVGTPSDEMKQLLIQVADEFFAAHRAPRIYVAECNDVEARAYAQELTLKLGTIVQPILLDEIDAASTADIIVTPYFHLQEVRDALGGDDDRVVGMVVTANSSDIARLATLVTTGPLGIVSVYYSAAKRLRRLIGFQIEVPMVVAATDTPETLRELDGDVECIAATVRLDREVWEQLPDVPSVVIRYHADEESIDLLRNEIQRLRHPGQAFLLTPGS